jgi:hypothetical protein
MPQQVPDPARRHWLGRTRNAAAAGAALAVLGPAVSAPTLPEPAAPTQPEPKPRGYHETEHTRRYYQLARF